MYILYLISFSIRSNSGHTKRKEGLDVSIMLLKYDGYKNKIHTNKKSYGYLGSYDNGRNDDIVKENEN